MKKSMKVLVIATLATAVAFATPQKASAGQKFSVDRISPYGTSVTLNLAKSSERTEVELSDSNGKVVDTKTYYKGAKYGNFLSLKKNKAYTVRYRSVDGVGDPISGWSKKIGFVTLNVEVKQVGKSMKASYKIPKIKGVKKFKVLISKKEKSGFKKVTTVKPGKKVILSKCYGKAFGDTSYYVKFQPVFKKKVKASYANITWFRFTKGFF